MNHFLKLSDLSGAEILSLLDLADKLKKDSKNGVQTLALAGKSVALIFQKASTRTRTSFEVGVYQLGGFSTFLSASDTQIGRGEPIEDTARVLSRYYDGIMIRTFKQSDVQALATYGSVPVINGLTDLCHPCQVLADLQTIREHKGTLEGLKMCYIGDGNNMANSLIVGALKTGMKMTAVCPKAYSPDAVVLALAASYGDKFSLVEKPEEGAVNADVLVTDVWTSMGEEAETALRQKAFAGYQINDALLKLAHSGCMVQHCLPAHRGEEITAEVFERHALEIFDEAENRLHAQKAVMARLMGGL